MPSTKRCVLSYFFIAVLIVLVDQLIKVWVHSNMLMGPVGRIKLIGEWFKLHYILNPGMAFGLKLGAKYGKLALTLGRIFATFLIGYYICNLARKMTSRIVLLGWSFVFGGALGNVIDSTFYGVVFKNCLPGSVSPWFHGQVIDMFYFDLLEARIPCWIPFFGGNYLCIFPIFNFADLAIMIGVALLLYDKNKKEVNATKTKNVEEVI